MKKIVVSILIIASCSCHNSSSPATLKGPRADTSNVSGDTSNKDTAHAGTNGYAPPNAKGGDTLSKASDTAKQR